MSSSSSTSTDVCPRTVTSAWYISKVLAVIPMRCRTATQSGGSSPTGAKFTSALAISRSLTAFLSCAPMAKSRGDCYGMPNSFGQHLACSSMTKALRYSCKFSSVTAGDCSSKISGFTNSPCWVLRSDGMLYSPRFAWGGRPHRMFILVRDRS